MSRRTVSWQPICEFEVSLRAMCMIGCLRPSNAKRKPAAAAGLQAGLFPA